MIETLPTAKKPCEWIGSAKEDLKAMPDDVQDTFGHAIYLAQIGMRFEATKIMQGFGGAGVLEVVEDFENSTYRAVYTVKFAGVIYVLHVFQKKSKRGRATPKHDVELIKTRLKRAEDHYRENYRRAG